MLFSRGLLRRTLRKPLICTDCESKISAKARGRQTRCITQNHLRNIRVAQEEWDARKADIQSGKSKSILEVLEERGLVNQIVGSRDKLNELLTDRRVGVYCGIDPTAASMHVGHMVPFMALGWMYIHGYAANFLLGGFTSTIGDPTDRLAARAEQKAIERKTNMLSMFDQLKRLAASMERYAEYRGYAKEWAWRRAVLNNNQWWGKLTFKDFMRIMGKDMRIGPMLGRDSVKNRLEKGDGMSFAEFSYPLVQGWDWWHMFQTGVQVQIGGADQYGNILAGAEAVKSCMENDEPFKKKLAEDTKSSSATTDPLGFTVPLLTTSSGDKFGKSAGNAIWINPEMTGSFDLYQFFLRLADADVEKYLKMLTFMPMNQIAAVMQEHNKDESRRIAQHKLAHEFVDLVHGKDAADKASQEHKNAFSKTMTIQDIQNQFQPSPINANAGSPSKIPTDSHPSLNKHAKPLDMYSTTDLNVTLPRSLVVQQPLSRILWSCGLASSRSEGQRLINNRGVYLGGRKTKDGLQGDDINYYPATDSKWSFVEPFLLEGSLLVLRTGKWKKKFVKIVPDDEYEESGLSCPGWDELKGEPDQAEADIMQEAMHRHEAHEKQFKQERRAEADRARQVFGEVKSARFS